MKFAPRRWLTALFLSLTGCVSAVSESVWHGARYAGKFNTAPVRLPRVYSERAREMRGIWIATVGNLDFPRCETPEVFQQRVRKLMKDLAAAGFNAVFFQVRPTNDAFYPSQLNPWSRFLTGTEGKPLAQGFDPLRFLIGEAHRNGLEFHAWLNPYRVARATRLSKKDYLLTLDPRNFARKNPHLVMETFADGERKLTLNPGEPAVRSFVTATVMELVRNYALDGIHFDDYFYPDYAPAAADAATFRKYGSGKLTQADWRRGNVNLLIQTLHREIAAYNRANRRKVRFGVSPAGIWRNRKNTPLGSLTGGVESYEIHCADTLLWVKSGWLDYIVPQLYWNFNHDTAAYAALCDWWSQAVRGTRTELYIGQGLYRLGESGWDRHELYRQLLYNQKHPEIKGSLFFSLRNWEKPANAVQRSGGRDMLRILWQKRVPAR